MRVGKVIGRVTLNVTYETLVGGRFLVVEVQDRFGLAGRPRKTQEVVIVYDHLGAGVGETIGFTESREASMPFWPEKKVPLDAYCAAIIDQVTVDASLI
jgi:microcompartment protein CcmK/EutM